MPITRWMVHDNFQNILYAHSEAGGYSADFDMLLRFNRN